VTPAPKHPYPAPAFTTRSNDRATPTTSREVPLIPDAPTRPEANDLAQLTRQYARFSTSAGGLSSVLGGTLALVSYFVGALWPPEVLAGRLALASAPLVWIGVRDLLRTHYYQRFGRVMEVRTRSEERWHLGFTLFTAAVSVIILSVFVFAMVSGRAPRFASPAVFGYLAFIVAMPALVWFHMRTPLEFIVGVFLTAQAALALVGAHYSLGEQPQAPIAGLAMIVVGIRQHREFRRIDRRLTRLGSP
jgi:hypothetical protein